MTRPLSRLAQGATLAASLLLGGQARATLIPPTFLNCVAAIGNDVPVAAPGQPPHLEFRAAGTGFFYGVLTHDDPEISKRIYDVYFVTARHVIDGLREANLSNVVIRVNPTDEAANSVEFSTALREAAGQNPWFFHPNPKIDVAAVKVNMNILRQAKVQSDFFPDDAWTADKKKMKAEGVSEGDGVFVLGFPLGLEAGQQRNYLIVRQGSIARITDALSSSSTTYLIDSLMFPGNSGGPVVSRPELVSIAGTPNHSNSMLIGMVLSFTSYIDTAVSQQTKRQRVTFEENSGLAEILPTDYIEEAISAWNAQNATPPTPTPPASTQQPPPKS